jgi:hypothetical protein
MYDLPTFYEVFKDHIQEGREWHPCEHFRIVCIPGTIPNLNFVRGDSAYYGTYEPSLRGIWEYHGPIAGHGVDEFGSVFGVPELSDAQAGAVSRKALDNALTQVPMEVSVANFLLELKKGLKELIPRVTKLLSVRTPAELLLWWKFGIDPTIRDIKAMFTVLAKTKKRLDYLRKVNKRTVTVRWKDRNIVAFGPKEFGDSDFSVGEVLTALSVEGIKYPQHLLPRVTAANMDIYVTMGVTYDLEGLEEAGAFWDALAAACGLNNPLSIYWESIPFSFVVDWFVAVGDWIDANADIPVFKGTIRPVSCSHTLVSNHTITWYTPTMLRYNGAARGWALWGMKEVCAANCIGYRRRNGLPNGSLITDGLTPMQQALGLSLAVCLGGRSKGRVRTRVKL